jgi:hypothetical protein
MPMKMPGSRRDIVTTDWRKLHTLDFSSSGEKGRTLNSDRSKKCICVCLKSSEEKTRRYLGVEWKSLLKWDLGKRD